MGFSHGKLGTANSFALDNILCLAQPSSIEEPHGKARQVEIDLQHISGRTRNVGNDRYVSPGEMVEQARFAGIRRANDNHVEAISKDLPSLGTTQMVNDFLLQAEHIIPDRCGDRTGNIILIREVQFGFYHCPAVGQSFRPRIVKAGQSSGRLFSREPALHLRLGCDQIGEPFDLREIHAAIGKSPARKLPSLGRT